MLFNKIAAQEIFKFFECTFFWFILIRGFTIYDFQIE